MGVDYVAMPLVRNADDVRQVKRLIRKEKRQVPVIAKLERREAIDALDDILAEADGVMVARGDLGLHFAPEKLPLLQKRIIREANQRGVMVITATQMLESMTTSPRPTRAEATDVANAVLDGTDIVMLSAETAIGDYPVEAVRMMSRIVVEAEQEPPARHSEMLRPAPAHSMARAAVRLAEDVGASAIVIFTRSGYSARLMSAERPRVPVLALTAEDETARQLALMWGISPVVTDIPRSLDGMLTRAEAKLSRERLLRAGDTVVIARWSPRRGSRWVNFVKLHKIGSETTESRKE
jgi:pyruvate kinase